MKNRLKEHRKEKEVANNERKFRQDPFRFTKTLLRENTEKVEPSFDQKEAEAFLDSNYGSPKEVDLELLKKLIKDLPDSKFQVPYNVEPVRPRDIRAFLKGRKSNSAPGPDGMTYGILKFLTCLHVPLATIFSRMKGEDFPKAQDGWETSKSILIFKRGDASTMENFRRIGLSNVMGKVYNALVSRDLTAYLTSNGIIDSTLQKAFIPGIDGSREHTTVLSEIVKNARFARKTLHLTSLDLRDAFGSTAHSLIMFLLRWARVPESVCSYISDFLDRLRTRVTTRAWTTEAMPIRVGTMQGDTLSPILFLLAINPVIEYLQREELEHGYALKNSLTGSITKFICTPFADDFNVMSRNKRSHQRILKNVHNRLDALRLTLKVSKCVSLSISSGSFQAAVFSLNNIAIPTADKKDMFILGMFIPATKTSTKLYEHIREKLNDALVKIDECKIRNEYKLRMYSRFFLPGLQYALTVHHLGVTHLEKLDALQNRYLRKWLKLPPSATRPILSSEVFGFGQISLVVEKARVGAYARMREKADDRVLAVLDCRIAREGTLLKDSMKPTIRADEIYSSVKEKSPELGVKQVIKASRQRVVEAHEKKCLEHLSKLTVQGKFSNIIKLQESDHFYRSIMFDLPHKQLSWLVRASIDCLPSFSNLRRWNKVLSNKCALCPRSETMWHVLNGCNVALNQKRYNLRHDSILLHIVKQTKASGCKKRIIADLEGYRLPGGHTIPQDIVVTNERPDLVLIDDETGKIELFDLTSCADRDSNIKNARSFKSNKYASLVADIGVERASFTPFEVCSLGNIAAESRKTLRKLFGSSASRQTFRTLAKIAISCSQLIFNSRRSEEWAAPALFERAVVLPRKKKA